MNHCMPLMTETMIVNESPKREHKGVGGGGDGIRNRTSEEMHICKARGEGGIMMTEKAVKVGGEP